MLISKMRRSQAEIPGGHDLRSRAVEPPPRSTVCDSVNVKSCFSTKVDSGTRYRIELNILLVSANERICKSFCHEIVRNKIDCQSL